MGGERASVGGERANVGGEGASAYLHSSPFGGFKLQ